jgi:hypothetical protein
LKVIETLAKRLRKFLIYVATVSAATAYAKFSVKSRAEMAVNEGKAV